MDLFEKEQQVYNRAMEHVKALEQGEALNNEQYIHLAKEYGRILRQFRRVTKIYDNTTDRLNTSKLDLLNKVYYDTLTGAYSRRFMEENLRRLVKSLFHSRGSLSVLMVDVDYFKLYNDTYGHSIGDDCLKSIAEALTGCMKRADDFVARYGGEEFIVVLPSTDQAGARVIANRLLESVRALCIPHEKNEAADCVTISIGITTGRVDRLQSGIEFVRRADEALYLSKQRGRNRFTYLSLMEESK